MTLSESHKCCRFMTPWRQNLKSLWMFYLTDCDLTVFQPSLCKWVCGVNREVEVLVFQACRDLTSSCCWGESLAVVLEGVSPLKVVSCLRLTACCGTAPFVPLTWVDLEEWFLCKLSPGFAVCLCQRLCNSLNAISAWCRQCSGWCHFLDVLSFWYRE